MYDRGLSVLEQYGLESNAVYRTRGALVCETGQGRVLIKSLAVHPENWNARLFFCPIFPGKARC